MSPTQTDVDLAELHGALNTHIAENEGQHTAFEKSIQEHTGDLYNLEGRMTRNEVVIAEFVASRKAKRQGPAWTIYEHVKELAPLMVLALFLWQIVTSKHPVQTAEKDAEKAVEILTK